MKTFLIALVCLAGSAAGLAQTADTDPATRDDVILLFQTMHSHDMLQRTMEAMSKGMRQMSDQELAKDHAQTPADLAAKAKREKMADEMLRGMPMDEITQAMIPAYQKHFTRGDIAAMNAFYASPVGQKVLQELPDVTQEGMKAAIPIMLKYLQTWKERLEQESGPSAKAASPAPTAQN